MYGSNLFIKKGSVFAYRLYDIAHEINLTKAQAALEAQGPTVRRYQLKKDPLRTVIMRDAPLIMSSGEEKIQIKIKEKDEPIEFSAFVEAKIWNYGVISFCYKIVLPENFNWRNLILLGSILDSNSIIDELSLKKREELIARLQTTQSLKKIKIDEIFEDYTTYLIEEVEEQVKVKTKPSPVTDELNPVAATEETVVTKIKDPRDLFKHNCVAELLLAEPTRALSDATRKNIQNTFSQYTKKDMIVLDWNTALVVDFTREKEYKDYVDLIEFSLAQLLELRIYDQRLDEKLDELYDALETEEYNKVTNFYSRISDESSRLYMEFSDFFEKLDNSIKTVGDIYLAKVLKGTEKRFGFEEVKKTTTRKIETLRIISSMCQDKVADLIDEQRNQIGERNTVVTHRMEMIIIILIAVEVIPVLFSHWQELVTWFNQTYQWFSNIF